MSCRRLQGKRVLVTGGSRGIGREIVLALAREGADVAFSYHHQQQQAQQVEEAVHAFGVEGIGFQLDVADRGAVHTCVEALRERWGGIDILVNNAGIAQEKPFETITDEDWDRLLAVNLKGAFIHIQEVLPEMVENGWGRIINISSIGGQWGGVNQVHYAVAKSGLIGLTRSIAKVYSGNGITCNAIAPGLVATDMTRSELESEAGQEKVRQIPAGRLGQASEVGAMVVFLCGDEAGYLTGQTMNLNGGMYFG